MTHTININKVPIGTTEGRKLSALIISRITGKDAKQEQHCEGDFHHSTYFAKVGAKRYGCTLHRFSKQATIFEL